MRWMIFISRRDLIRSWYGSRFYRRDETLMSDCRDRLSWINRRFFYASSAALAVMNYSVEQCGRLGCREGHGSVSDRLPVNGTRCASLRTRDIINESRMSCALSGTGLSKLSKIPGWCSLVSRRVSGSQERTETRAGRASLFSRSLFTVTYVTRRESLFLPLRLSNDRSRFDRRIRAYRMGACKNSVIACRVRCTRASGSCVHLPSREIVSWESLLLSETLTRNHWRALLFAPGNRFGQKAEPIISCVEKIVALDNSRLCERADAAYLTKKVRSRNYCRVKKLNI